ncbi:collagen-binding domain-containing protein [Weissella tructae]|uniref:collagen-binding domain-containing protein n=1 Tax=Weissella tructae TaxID=887702 RepID=UPI003D91C0E9
MHYKNLLKSHMLIMSALASTMVLATTAKADDQTTLARPHDNHHIHGDHHKPKGKFTKEQVSRVATNYNAIILGNHTVHTADIEGAAAVKGDVIVKGGFTFGAAASGFDNVVVGDPKLPTFTPSLVLGGNMNIQTTSMPVMEGNGFVTRESVDLKNRVSDRDNTALTFNNDEMDNFFATLESQMYQRQAAFSKMGADVKAKPGFELEVSKEDKDVVVVNISGDDVQLKDIWLPEKVAGRALTDYNRIIVKTTAKNVTFGPGGSIVYNNGVVNTGAPNKDAGNATMRMLAGKIVWLFPEVETIQANGYGIIGDMYAPKATMTTKGGSLNGQLFINNLTQDGGFEVHNLLQGAQNPPLLKPDHETENEEHNPDETTTPLPKEPDYETGNPSEEENHLHKPEVTEPPTVEVKPNEENVEKLPDEEEVEEFPKEEEPKEDNATETEEPKLEEKPEVTEPPTVEVKPNEENVEKLPDEEEVEEFPKEEEPKEDNATETEEPKLEEKPEVTEPPTVEVKPNEENVEKLPDEEEVEEFPKEEEPKEDNATETEEPKLEEKPEVTEPPTVEVKPNEEEVEELPDEEEVEEFPKEEEPKEDNATETEEPKLEEKPEVTEPPTVEVKPNEENVEEIPGEEEVEEMPEVEEPKEDNATETEEPKLEEKPEITEPPVIEVNPNEETVEEIPGEEKVEEIPEVEEPKEDNATETEEPKLEEKPEITEPPVIEVNPNEETVEEIPGEEEVEEMPEVEEPKEDNATETEEPKLEEKPEITEPPVIEVDPNEETVEEIPGEEEVEEIPEEKDPDAEVATETEEPGLEDPKSSKPTPFIGQGNDEKGKTTSGEKNHPSVKTGKETPSVAQELPETGTGKTNVGIIAVGFATLLTTLGTYFRRR